MLVPSKKIFYAVEAVLFISFHSRSGPISSAEIAAKQGLPPRYLEPLMQKLVKSGILRGVRGPQGGYVLGRERRRIALKDICDVVAEEKDLPDTGTPLGLLVLKPEVHALIGQWESSLAEVTIATLCDRANALRLASHQETATDFAI